MDIQLGKYTVQQGEQLPTRLAMLLWGMNGCGKTTLAATAPGKKLWINFDPDGPASITGLRDSTTNPKSALNNEILVVDLSGERNNVVEQFKREDALGLGKLLADDSIGIDTVVVDSVTRVSQMALEHTITSGMHKGATIERPSPGAYQGRNALTLRVVNDILIVTKKYNKNVIFITHEAAPNTNDDGVVQFITMSLGGQLPNLSASQLSEVWYMADNGKQRKIAVRPVRMYKPMKTRMFDIGPGVVPEFIWEYDINKPNEAFEIATWYNTWREGNGRKIQFPKG